MVAKILADASPQKRLFISLITRDISLADAMLDLIDNSINAALQPLADQLKTADDYQRLLATRHMKPKVHIYMRINSARIAVDDNAPGIPLEMARQHVFRFGREEKETDPTDRLSVYGIGLKRAMFKCGNRVTITSDHKNGGFELKLPDVAAWAREKETPENDEGLADSEGIVRWTLPITPRPPAPKTECGTRVMITELHDDILRRIDDGLFLGQLRNRIAQTYSFFIGRVIDITLNNELIKTERFDIGANHTSQKFKTDNVSCIITAGIALTTEERFRERNAGWYVFCNGRAVLYANKDVLTGWGAGLPLFQAKHRPFLGTVFFVSTDAEALPWNTMKSSINEENLVWQTTRRHMIAVGRIVTRFLDERYKKEGTEIAPADLQEAAGARMSMISAAVANERTFMPPTKPPPKTVRIQYEAKTSDVTKIERHLKRNMGGSEVGRFTFNWYLENEVGNAE